VLWRAALRCVVMNNLPPKQTGRAAAAQHDSRVACTPRRPHAPHASRTHTARRPHAHRSPAARTCTSLTKTRGSSSYAGGPPGRAGGGANLDLASVWVVGCLIAPAAVQRSSRETGRVPRQEDNQQASRRSPFCHHASLRKAVGLRLLREPKILQGRAQPRDSQPRDLGGRGGVGCR
jgi:hypothetical protein